MKLSGGTKLEAYLENLAKNAKKPAVLQVGFLEGATYPATSRKALRAHYKKSRAASPTAATGAAGGLPVAAVAAFQNFGTRRIPPRPFFSNMIADKSPEWGDNVAKLLPQQDFNAKKTLGLMGELIVGQLRQSIRDTNSPALADSTIRAKGFSKPLVDTAHMLNSADYVVKS